MMRHIVFLSFILTSLNIHAMPPAPQGPYQSLEDELSSESVSVVKPSTTPSKGPVTKDQNTTIRHSVPKLDYPMPPQMFGQPGKTEEVESWQPYNRPYQQLAQ